MESPTLACKVAAMSSSGVGCGPTACLCESESCASGAGVGHRDIMRCADADVMLGSAGSVAVGARQSSEWSISSCVMP